MLATVSSLSVPVVVWATKCLLLLGVDRWRGTTVLKVLEQLGVSR